MVLPTIKIYQKTISPDHGVFRVFLRPYIGCRFYPTCSEYSYFLIKKILIFFNKKKRG